MKYNCFPKGYECKISELQPESLQISCYKAGEGKRIYLQFIIFYEKIEGY
jgi:hypothetical protein